MAYRINPRVAHSVIGGEAVLVDLAGAVMLGLNATGSHIWALLPQQDEEAIAWSLSERFAVPVETARVDVRAFLDELVRRGILSNAEP
jgi:hypothetical protein